MITSTAFLDFRSLSEHARYRLLPVVGTMVIVRFESSSQMFAGLFRSYAICN